MENLMVFKIVCKIWRSHGGIYDLLVGLYPTGSEAALASFLAVRSFIRWVYMQQPS
jgi:hypothetical protein